MRRVTYKYVASLMKGALRRVHKIGDLVAKAGSVRADSNPWIRALHTSANNRVRLVLLPHAGGSATYYFALSKLIPATVDVLAVQYPGRQDRRHEKCIESIAGLADGICEALLDWIDRPVVFFGHSMGATLAFEVARRLEHNLDFVTAGIFASARRAPCRHRDEYIHRNDDVSMIAELRKLGGAYAQWLDDEEFAQMVLPPVRADYLASETYRYQPGPPLRSPIIAMIGDADPRVSLDEAQSWREHTAAEFNLRIFPGGHFYIDAYRTEVADALTRHAEGR